MPNPVDTQVTLYSDSDSSIERNCKDRTLSVVAGTHWDQEGQSRLSLIISQLTLLHQPSTITVDIKVTSLASLQLIRCVLCRFHPSVRVSKFQYSDPNRRVDYEASMVDPHNWSSTLKVPLDLLATIQQPPGRSQPNDQRPRRESEAQILVSLGLPISQLVVLEPRYTMTTPPLAVAGLVGLIKSLSSSGHHYPLRPFAFTTTTPGARRPTMPLSTLTIPSAFGCEQLFDTLAQALKNPHLSAIAINPLPSPSYSSSAHRNPIANAIRLAFEESSPFSLDRQQPTAKNPNPPHIIIPHNLTTLRLPATYICPSVIRAIANKFPMLNALGFITTPMDDDRSHLVQAQDAWAALVLSLRANPRVIFPMLRDLRVGCAPFVYCPPPTAAVETARCAHKDLTSGLWGREARIWFPALVI